MKNRVRILVLPLLLTGLLMSVGVGMVSCGSSSSNSGRFYVGYATYWIEFYDYVIDWTGRTQRTYCSDYLTFTGDIDGLCAERPMVWSYGKYDWLYCVYTDSFGAPWWYYEYYYFPSGYIQEPPCKEDGLPTYEPDENPDVYQASTQSRNDARQIEISRDIDLGDELTPLSVLRALFEARFGSLPEGLSADEPTIVRTSEVTEGEAPAEGTGDVIDE